MSNVIMAFVSIVNTVPGPPPHRAKPVGLEKPGPAQRKRAGMLIRSAAAGGAIAAAALLRRHFVRWGATAAESEMILPGDGLLPTADLVATRAITISAAAQDVWPWIAQLGQDRGGFYSYDALENLVHCDIHSADHIHSEWQQIAVGAEVNLAPGVPLTVAVFEPDRALVLQGGVPMGKMSAPYDYTWSFVVQPAQDGTSRLLVRERYRFTRRWAALIVEPAEIVSCLMSPAMLRGIKKRAEQTHFHPVLSATTS